MDNIRLRHDEDRQRYEAHLGEACVAVLYYEDEDATGTVVRDMRSTIVSPDHANEGIGSVLVRFALDDAREAGLPVKPTCWFVAGWIQRHPEYADLLAEAPLAPDTPAEGTA